MSILDQIVASKRTEIEGLYREHDLSVLISGCYTVQDEPLFYQRLAFSKAIGKPFFISEFKRKSPSEGWIHQDANLPDQIRAYAKAGAGAISVLTDEPFFGGTYEDLKLARQTLKEFSDPPLLLQKEFILDPIQIYLAKLAGADLILLIAAILEPEKLEQLFQTATSIGLGVLVEVHDAEELGKVQHLEFPVLGVNNRDLKTFRTALNRVNTLRSDAKGRYLISESGVLNHGHFQMVKHADGFLIGTGLMMKQPALAETFDDHFHHQGKWLFKACGIRTAEIMQQLESGHDVDFIGINFSPVSKRKLTPDAFEAFKPAGYSRLVAVFYQNSEEEILGILKRFPFKTIQLYAGDVTPEFVRSLKVRVILAVKTPTELPNAVIMETLVEPYAADVDCFILDGAQPGAGVRIEGNLPEQFPYPFLLAGGLHETNLDAAGVYGQCIGVDIASGIESMGEVDFEKIQRIGQALASLPLPHDLSDCI
jgi:indole-3-glycerol phosphate synthase/phosphoribosylanthranilate isomerase/anthranilate synthase/indole-3-glycerol phosphate synthase/phosphoribosylanthranilate isomerase